MNVFYLNIGKKRKSVSLMVVFDSVVLLSLETIEVEVLKMESGK